MVRAGGWAGADAGALLPLIEGELDQLLHPLPHESVRQSSGLLPVSARAQVRCGMLRAGYAVCGLGTRTQLHSEVI